MVTEAALRRMLLLLGRLLLRHRLLPRLLQQCLLRLYSRLRSASPDTAACSPRARQPPARQRRSATPTMASGVTKSAEFTPAAGSQHLWQRVARPRQRCHLLCCCRLPALGASMLVEVLRAGTSSNQYYLKWITTNLTMR